MSIEGTEATTLLVYWAKRDRCIHGNLVGGVAIGI